METTNTILRGDIIMFNKVKEFYKKHDVQIAIIGGLTVMVVGKVLFAKYMADKTIPTNLLHVDPDIVAGDNAVLESYGAMFKPGYSVPFATKEVVDKFIKERGNTYQIDILDDLTSVVWISK